MTFKVRDGIQINDTLFVDGSRNVSAYSSTVQHQLGIGTATLQSAEYPGHLATDSTIGDFVVRVPESRAFRISLNIDDPAAVKVDYLGVSLTGILTAAVRMKDQTRRWMTPEPGHLQRVRHKAVLHVRLHAPTH